jgi:hypothetical protein
VPNIKVDSKISPNSSKVGLCIGKTIARLITAKVSQRCIRGLEDLDQCSHPFTVRDLGFGFRSLASLGEHSALLHGNIIHIDHQAN